MSESGGGGCTVSSLSKEQQKVLFGFCEDDREIVFFFVDGFDGREVVVVAKVTVQANSGGCQSIKRTTEGSLFGFCEGDREIFFSSSTVSMGERWWWLQRKQREVL